MMAGSNLYEEVLIAGFGGQGIIMAGKLLAYASMRAGKQVTCMPSYGAEVRGGTANCMVVIADTPIASPLVNKPDSLIAMNKASVDKFVSRINNGGLLVYNSSLINERPHLLDSVKMMPVPADELAVEIGDKRIANIVILGAYLRRKNILNLDYAISGLGDVLAKKHKDVLDINTAALKRGAEFAEKTGLKI